MNSFGLLIAAISALLYAALIVINKQISRASGIQTAAIELDVAFIVVLVYTLCASALPHLTGKDLPYIAVIGFINAGLAYLLYFSDLQKLSGQSVALISYLLAFNSNSSAFRSSPCHLWSNSESYNRISGKL